MTLKKLFAILLTLILIFAMTACGGDDPTPAGDNPATVGEDPAPNNEDVNLSGYLATKTGKFYSQFTENKMYLEYEMEMEGMKMTMISASKGDKSYSETIIDGVSSGISVMEGDTMYVIDHGSKMVMKTAMNTDAATIATEILEEEDVDMTDLKTGTYTIDGKTYDTEEWELDGAVSIMCFDGDDLAYMVGIFEGEEMIMKVVEISDKVDDKLFEIPADYALMEF